MARGGVELLFDQSADPSDSGYLAFYDLDEEPDWENQAADDFVVPADEIWEIEIVFAGGFYLGLINPVNDATVFFYEDDDGTPGALLYAAYNLFPLEDDDGNLTFELPDAAVFDGGTYWVSVQPVMDYFEDGRWYWRGEESDPFASIWHWRNPGGAWGTGCDDWTPADECFTNPLENLTFRLYGQAKPAVGSETGNELGVELRGNYPNPFFRQSAIEFSIAEAGPVYVAVYDVTGRKVTTLVDGEFAPGTHTVEWNAEGLAAGMYFYRIQAGSFTQAQRAMIVR